MGGSRVIWQSILRQAGAVQVNDTEEMAQANLAFAMLPPKAFRGISIVGGGGAIGVTACDTAETYGIEIPALPPELQERIGSVLPKPGSSAINPIDVANPFVGPQALKEVLLGAAQDERIELQIIVSLLFHYKGLARAFGIPITEAAPYKELTQCVRDVIDQTGKPVIAVLPNMTRGTESMDITELIALTRQEYLSRGIPVFDELHDAIRAISHVNNYYGGKIK
jgi:acyl-CoA synthetase (NDP forming)